jgi:hypothetical protein
MHLYDGTKPVADGPPNGRAASIGLVVGFALLTAVVGGVAFLGLTPMDKLHVQARSITDDFETGDGNGTRFVIRIPKDKESQVAARGAGA